MREIMMSTTGKWQTVGTTHGLSRYHSDVSSTVGLLQAEQVYLDKTVDPKEFPHPDGGKLEPRVYRIRRGRGYSFTPVLELTRQQAIELAKLILEDVGDEAWRGTPHPGRQWDATTIRAIAKSMSRELDEIASAIEAL